MLATPPSGAQYEIRAGSQRAAIVEVGGGVREYRAAGRPVLDPYPAEAMCDGARGTPLIPWPNRLADGAYRFDGTDLGVPFTEPDKHNTIHGFLRWRPWQVLEHQASRVVMGIRLHPLPGYAFSVDVRVAYELGDGGLVVATTATNLGNRACPYGAGQQPYLSPGGRVDDCTLELGASTRIRTDNERQRPVGTAAVEGTDFGFRAGKRLGGQKLDTPFTDLARGDQGRARACLTAPDGSRVELWADRHHRVIEIYTGDILSPARRRLGLSTEPMSCPQPLPERRGLIRLEPAQPLTTIWGVRLCPA